MTIDGYFIQFIPFLIWKVSIIGLKREWVGNENDTIQLFLRFSNFLLLEFGLEAWVVLYHKEKKPI